MRAGGAVINGVGFVCAQAFQESGLATTAGFFAAKCTTDFGAGGADIHVKYRNQNRRAGLKKRFGFRMLFVKIEEDNPLTNAISATRSLRSHRRSSG